MIVGIFGLFGNCFSILVMISEKWRKFNQILKELLKQKFVHTLCTFKAYQF